MEKEFLNCNLCPRNCNINRYETLGFCMAPPKIKIAKADIDNENVKELKEKYEIKGYPTMLIFKNGEEVKRILGYREESEILKEIR